MFSRGGTVDIAYFIPIVGDATQMDVPTKKMSNVTATVANSVFPERTLYTEQTFVLVSMDILKT